MCEPVGHHIFRIARFAAKFDPCSAKDLEHALNTVLGMAVSALGEKAYLRVAILRANDVEVSQQRWSNWYIKANRNQHIVEFSVGPFQTACDEFFHALVDALVLWILRLVLVGFFFLFRLEPS